MATLLWILAVILVIVTLIRGGVLAGIALIIVGLLVGPGEVSIFAWCDRRRVYGSSRSVP